MVRGCSSSPVGATREPRPPALARRSQPSRTGTLRPPSAPRTTEALARGQRPDCSLPGDPELDPQPLLGSSPSETVCDNDRPGFQAVLLPRPQLAGTAPLARFSPPLTRLPSTAPGPWEGGSWEQQPRGPGVHVTALPPRVRVPSTGPRAHWGHR